ncbi:MAG: molecular chaperone DnaJ [Candidatus Buchananbacteria bacterium]
MSRDYYEVLGVTKNATQDEVKKAFHKLAHQHHPDKKGGNEAKFKEINEAYQVLSNVSKRQQYDQFGANFGSGNQGGSGGGGFSWQDFSRAQQQSGGFGGGNPFGDGAQFDFGDLGDVFSDFFGFSNQGGGRGKKQTPKGRDMQVQISLPFIEAVFGVEKTFDLPKNVNCEHCAGSGAEPGSKVKTCPTCGGQGRVGRIQRTILGNFQAYAVCDACQGEGVQIEKKCVQCHGVGVVRETKKIKVKIPAGISTGQSIHLPHEGEAVGKKGQPGDLYILVQVEADPRFNRQGDDIYSKINLNIIQATLGDKIEIETVDGPIKLTIPEGTQAGTIFRLAGKGVPKLKRFGRGDHLVETVVKVPKHLNRRQRELLEEFKKVE